MDLSGLSAENIGLTIGVGAAAALVGFWKYLTEKKAPPEPKAGDVIVTGGMIADMGPVRGIDASQKSIEASQRSIATDMTRIAMAVEGMLAIMRERQEYDEAARENELRDMIRNLERRVAEEDNKPGLPPRRRR